MKKLVGALLLLIAGSLVALTDLEAQRRRLVAGVGEASGSDVGAGRGGIVYDD